MSELEQAKELYPKFYGSPEKYLGIYVECIKTYMDGDCQWTKGCVIRLTLDMLHCIYEEQNKLDHYIPKFKPQEGEAFIKDLEEAVSAGLNKTESEYVVYYPNESTPNALAFSLLQGVAKIINVCIYRENISKVKCAEWDGDALTFDTAAYVDTLRQKGYYL